MYIEDLIIDLNSYVKVNLFDSNIVTSFSNQIFSGKGFTEKQSLLAIKLLKKYCNNLEIATKKIIAPELMNPQFRFPIRKIPSLQHKRVSITTDSQWGKVIKVEFPYSEEKVGKIRKNRENLGHAMWDGDVKAWHFCLSEPALKFVRELTLNEPFEYDDEFKDYLDQVDKIVNTIESHVPMLILEGNTAVFKNVSEYLPKIDSTNILAAVFAARKSGIYTWDEKINDILNEADLHPLIKNFLNNNYTGIFEIDSAIEPIDCLKDIVQHMNPCLFVIPGGSELEKTTMVYNFLTKLGYSNEEMSVMFRLPNAEGKNFNNFVKNCGLNNAITDKTKFVFVSIKLPKPILKSKMKFNSVVSLGRSNVHYTIRDFFKNRENLIYYCEPSKQKEFNFGFL
jgi:hypothetical protein